MVPRPIFGWTYARCVAEPLALQVVGAVSPGPGSRVAVLLDDLDLLGAALRLHGAEPVGWDGTGSPPPADAVVSLLTLGFADMPTVLRTSREALRGAGIAAHVVYDAAAPPPAELVLGEAARRLGRVSPHLGRLIPAGALAAARNAGYATVALREVARFDGPVQLWRALVEERPVADDLAGVTEEAMAALRAEVVSALGPRAAADGTLRIPFTAALLCAPA